jgi:competence protein ComEA
LDRRRLNYCLACRRSFIDGKKGANANSSTPVDSRDQQISDLQSQVAALQKENTALKSEPKSQPVASTSTGQNQSTTSSQPTGKININSATAAQLDSLPGIGPTYAQRIIDYRNQHGNFTSTSQIQNVKGIGPKTYAKFQALITI